MAESIITCPLHGLPLIPDGAGGETPVLMCPDATCDTSVRIDISGGLPSSPLTYLEAGAAHRHELLRAHEAAGFSRTEAMQIVCVIITASIMKGAGDE